MPRFIATFLCLFFVFFAVHAEAEEIVLNAVGDIMLAGRGTTTYRRLGYDYPFAATRQQLSNGDLAIGNLEAPSTDRGSEFRDKRFRFRVDPAVAPALKNAGFSVLTIANNHMMDFGAVGLQDTIDLLDRNGILHAGAGETLAAARQAATVTIKGKRLAFLAYSLTLPPEFYATDHSPGTAPGYLHLFREDIANARQSADYVIVSFHWGTERAERPHPYQIRAAHSAIDAGADVVLGHHPHVLQGIERYNSGVIFYSLGNFAFGSMSPSANRSVIARITLGEGVTGVELLPLNVLNSRVHYQPRILEGREGEEVIAHLRRISTHLGTTITSSGGRHLIDMEGSGLQRLARK